MQEVEVRKAWQQHQQDRKQGFLLRQEAEKSDDQVKETEGSGQECLEGRGQEGGHQDAEIKDEGVSETAGKEDRVRKDYENRETASEKISDFF